MNIYHLDYETRSRADLRKVGAARYAADPSTRILMFAIRRNNEEPKLWLNPAFGVPCLTNSEAFALLTQAVNEPSALIYAHNVLFELFVSHYRMESDIGIKPPAVERWRCTAALARKAGLRDSLADLGDDLGLTQLKFGYGYQLIRVFSIPQKKTDQFIEPSEEREKFIEFGKYCVRDVLSESEAHARLKPFELKGLALQTFLFDLRMNLRGFPVNVPALRHAQTLVEAKQQQVAKEFVALTGLQPSQRDKVKALLTDKYGVRLKNMQAKTLDEAVDDLEVEVTPDDADARRILELYKQVSFAAVKKVKTMLDCVCPDGYVRGMFTWHGAGTGRWTAQKVQPQNFRKPNIDDADTAYAMICAGASQEEIESCYDNALETVANCIRNFIQPHEGEMLDADYSAIEARIVAWLANEKWRLDVFKTHGKIYEASACQMFNLTMAQVTKPIRQKGKVAELALGYQGAVNAMIKMGALDMGLAEDELPSIVKAWRRANKQVVATWYELEDAARTAILSPGSTQMACDGKIKFRTATISGIPYLLMVLPSGRNVAYPHPKWSQEEGITYYGEIPGTSRHGRVSLYGGKILENAVQGIAADLMGLGAVTAEERGFLLWALIHDQALAAATDTIQNFIAALTTLPDWASGLPLTADGYQAPYYRKE